MTVLVTGSSGHLGEALVRTLAAARRDVIGIDLLPGPFTHQVGSIVDRAFVRRCMPGVATVFHAATLHKPHVATHGRQDFVDTNITGTLNLLEEAASAGVSTFVYTSTTSVFGDALTPRQHAPAAWITEHVVAVPKNIYGATKAAIRSFARSWTADLKERNIRVNVLSPGPTQTPGFDVFADAEMKNYMKSIVPLGRIGTADEIAKAALFLASDDSSYVAGVELFVDGGSAAL